ncbi:putative Phytocyanin domain, cupredoxin [Helianthus annuus]|nr:putative Phytocyanin domain, cupredoxin [Helianthus annuus]
MKLKQRLFNLTLLYNQTTQKEKSHSQTIKKMGAFNFNIVVFMAMVVSMAFCSSATQHIVGDAFGWVIPNNRNLYADWASQRMFTVGDSLVFDFLTGTHDVTEVSKDDYDHCHVSNPGSIITTSRATINLTSPGDHYYICSLEGHCMFHQKLAINVVMKSLF